MTNTLPMARRLMIALSGDLTLSAADRQWLQHPAVGGVILFARNFADAEQLRRLTADIRRTAQWRLLIAADQEGGRVCRFRGDGFSPLPPMLELAALTHDDEAKIYHAAGLVLAAELLAAGIDLSFAPVLDLASGRSQVIGDRAFGATADLVVARALSFVAGMKAAGMASCGKHFPGHGYAAADSHTDFAVDTRTEKELAADLSVFARTAATIPALMTAHVAYPECDTAAATFSSYWLKKVLRERLHFDGLIISDDLTMAGANIGAMPTRMQAAMAAGCDVLLVCQPAAVAEALAALSLTDAAADNPWLSLSPTPDGRVCIGDKEYRQARETLALADPA